MVRLGREEEGRAGLRGLEASFMGQRDLRLWERGRQSHHPAPWCALEGIAFQRRVLVIGMTLRVRHVTIPNRACPEGEQIHHGPCLPLAH